jgi:hypothetical protein
MSYGESVELSCPGGCGAVYTRTDYTKGQTPPIPFRAVPKGGYWSDEDTSYFDCWRCGVNLEDEYHTVIELWSRGPVGGWLYDYRRALFAVEESLSEFRDNLTAALKGLAA